MEYVSFVSWITTCWDILYLMFDILSFVFDVILELYLDNLNSKWAHTTIAKYSSCCKWRWCSVETWALHTQSAPWWWLCLTWLWCKVSAREWFLSEAHRHPRTNKHSPPLLTVKGDTSLTRESKVTWRTAHRIPISTINRSGQNIGKIYRREVYLSVYLTTVTQR